MNNKQLLKLKIVIMYKNFLHKQNNQTKLHYSRRFAEIFRFVDIWFELALSIQVIANTKIKKSKNKEMESINFENYLKTFVYESVQQFLQRNIKF